MELTLIRKEFFPDCTIGDLSIDSERICFTLEDPTREIEGVPITDWKIPGRTAIPYGRYQVILMHSPRFDRLMPHLWRVTGFEDILIHWGNTASDTNGCLLIGLSWNPERPNWIGRSKEAFSLLFPRLQAPISKECWITITRAAEPPPGGAKES